MNSEIVSYYDKLASTYDENRFANSYGKFIDKQENLFLSKLIKKNNFKNVLDLGCGTGRLLHFANFGVDPSENMISVSKEKFPEKIILKGSVTEIPFENETFNLIFSFHVLMHLDKQTTSNFLNESFDKLMSNGKLVFDFPSKKRRKLLNFKSKNWHGANDFSIEELKIMSSKKYKIISTNGILFLPIQRFPKFSRAFFTKIDSFFCNSFLKQYSSYIIIELQKK